MGSARDYYEILGLNRDADSNSVKKAYRKLALEYHPDRNTSEEAVVRFREIQEAYEVLSDSEKRQIYDQFGHAGLSGRLRTGPMDDIFEGFQSIFDDFFGGGGGGGRRRQQKGADLRYRLRISLKEAVLGCTKEIKVKRHKVCAECDGQRAAKGTSHETCPTCGGAGRLRRSQGFFVIAQDCPQCQGSGRIIPVPCPECSGTGFEEDQASVDVKVPEGVDTGIRLRLSGEGEVSESGGIRGDLFVEIEVEEDDVFDRDGAHLYTSLQIPFTLAVFGGEIEIPLIDSSRKMEIKALKESPSVLVIENEGARDLRTQKKGDLYVELQIELPQKLSKKAKDLLTELRSELETNPKPGRRKKEKRGLFGF